jgi:anaerobic selenocysteine-containing dehydrogenase
LDDRYRGVFGRRDVVFMNVEDLAGRGLKDGDRIDVLGLIGGADGKHVVRGYTVVAYDIPRGSMAGYYPEMNGVMSLQHYDPQSGTPSYKGVPVRVAASAS